MKNNTITKFSVAFVGAALLLLTTGCGNNKDGPAQFESAPAAVDALVASVRTDDVEKVQAILGPDAEELLNSGDPVSDRNGRELFLRLYDQRHRLNYDGTERASLLVGQGDWPLPIPLVRSAAGRWTWDSAAGVEEMINRRIGRNELNTVQVCLSIVAAQREYALTDPDQDGNFNFAQKFMSDPGRRNGLYWPTASPDEPESPLGELIVAASHEGYTVRESVNEPPRPYHGYRFRMITTVGPATRATADAGGGSKSIGGFIVIAYPAEYDVSGIMTFVVTETGIVYERDLGEETDKLANEVRSFQPTPEWKKSD